MLQSICIPRCLPSCRDTRCIVLRQIHFRERKPYFLATWDEEPQGGAGLSEAGTELTVLRVRSELRDEHWADLLAKPEKRTALTDQLVLHSSSVTRVLAKCDEFVHTYVNTAGCDPAAMITSGAGPRMMLFELPRFQLEFELAGGALRSLDYKGYCLRACQQLMMPNGVAAAASNFMLPDFKQYLLLQREGAGAVGQRAELMVLVPVGVVQRTAAEVTVRHDDWSGANLQASSLQAQPRPQDWAAQTGWVCWAGHAVQDPVIAAHLRMCPSLTSPLWRRCTHMTCTPASTPWWPLRRWRACSWRHCTPPLDPCCPSLAVG